MFGVTRIVAVDGFSRKFFTTIPRKIQLLFMIFFPTITIDRRALGAGSS